jgi:hypothetical protein
MSETGFPEISIVGAPDSAHDGIRRSFHSSAIESRKRQIAELRYARLSPDKLDQARAVESACKEYFAAKMLRLGLPAESMLELPGVYYTHPKYKKDKDTGGNFVAFTNVTQVFVSPQDFFGTLNRIPHEQSHAGVSREVDYPFPDNEDLSKAVIVGGLGFIEDHKEKGEGMEEGMVLWDQVNFFHTYMSKMYPAAYSRARNLLIPSRRMIGQSPYAVIKDYQSNVDPSLYGRIHENIEHIIPFLSFPRLAERIPILKAIGEPELQTPGMIKEYLFGRKLGELVGRNASGTYDASMDTDTAIKAGRDILDRDRYLRTGDARQQVIRVLGDDKAQKVFSLHAHDKANIDGAMHTLVDVQAQHVA